MYRAFVAVSVALLALVVCQHGGSLPVDEVAMDERCDAEDNDGDGLVDEGLDCNPRCIDDCAAVDQCGSRGAADPLCALTTNERSKISPFLQAWCNNARAIDVLVEMTSTEDVLAAEECVEVISDYTMFPWFHVNVDGRYGLAALARQVNVVSLEEDTTVLYPLE